MNARHRKRQVDFQQARDVVEVPIVISFDYVSFDIALPIAITGLLGRFVIGTTTDLQFVELFGSASS